jgi:hypothetical protein
MKLEVGRVDLDRAEYLYALSLPGDRNLWLAAHWRPGLIQRQILAKTGFVLED